MPKDPQDIEQNNNLEPTDQVIDADSSIDEPSIQPETSITEESELSEPSLDGDVLSGNSPLDSQDSSIESPLADSFGSQTANVDETAEEVAFNPMPTTEQSADAGLGAVSDAELPAADNLQSNTDTPSGVPIPPVTPMTVGSTGDFQIAGSELAPKPWWKTKKFIIGAAAAVTTLLILGGGAFAYTSYQNPEKVVADSLINIFTVKRAVYSGKFEYDYSSTGGYSDVKVKVALDFTSKLAEAGQQNHNAKLSIEYDGKKYSLEGDTLFDKVGDIYFRVQGIKAVVDDMKESFGLPADSEVSATIDKIVNKLDGTWVRISTDDLKSFDEDYSKTKKCVNDTMDKFKDDRDAIVEVADLYRKNPYVVIKKDLGIIDGNFTYEVTHDFENGKEFVISLKDTKIYKALHDCDSKSFNIDEKAIRDSKESDYNDPDTKQTESYKLSVDMWSHRIAKFEATNKMTSSSYGSTSTTNGSLVITPDYNTEVTVTAPTKFISLKEFQDYIGELFGKSYSSSNDRANEVQAQSNANSAANIAEVFYAENNYYPSTTASFGDTDATSIPDNIIIASGSVSLAEDNGRSTVTWSCLNTCNRATGGRIGYYNFSSAKVDYIYVGNATAGGVFVNPVS